MVVSGFNQFSFFFNQNVLIVGVCVKNNHIIQFFQIKKPVIHSRYLCVFQVKFVEKITTERGRERIDAKNVAQYHSKD